MLQTVTEKTIWKKEVETSKTETPQDTSRVVRHLHLASTLFSGSSAYKQRNRTARLLILWQVDHRLQSTTLCQTLFIESLHSDEKYIWNLGPQKINWVTELDIT